ncbi:MAG TPA: GAF and ANTAR domain-containing protein [Acidimicrobiales bacterium]|nr:GAF and ANTAR domain-containing protein [Acidimicrobiales bacterium]
MLTREEQLSRTFVELADTLVDDFDVVELLTLLVNRSVELFDAAAGGLVLADEGGRLRLMASTSEASHVVEVFAVQANEGPCLDCWRSGEPVLVDDLNAATERWPGFVPFAIESGFAAAHAVPLRLRGEMLGALALFRSDTGGLGSADLAAAQALADVAAIAIIQSRAVRSAKLVAEQLQTALLSRVAIEQAKGMLAERCEVDVDRAFALMRNYSRTNRRRLSEVASDMVRGTLDPSSVLAAGGGRSDADLSSDPR